MKRLWSAVAAAAVLGAFTGTASADPGGFTPPGPNSGYSPAGPTASPGTLMGAFAPPDRAPERFGWNPIFRNVFKHNKSKCGPNCGQPGGDPHDPRNPLANPANWAAGGYGQGGPAYNPQGFPPGANGPNGPMMQGTLAFPNHPFVRSPRDYFMYDLNK